MKEKKLTVYLVQCDGINPKSLLLKRKQLVRLENTLTMCMTSLVNFMKMKGLVLMEFSSRIVLLLIIYGWAY